MTDPVDGGAGRRLRVGLVCPYSLDTHGGVQQHVLGLAAALRRLGHAVAVLAPGEPGRPRPAGVTVVGAGPAVPFNGSVAPVRPGSRAAVRAWLRRGVDGAAFDVVHVHEPAAPSTSYEVVRALLGRDRPVGARVPVVATHHIAQERSWALRLAAPTVLRAVLARLDASIVVSEEARRTLRRYHPAADTAVLVPNGVDAAAFVHPAPPLARRRDVVFVGRPEEPRKGFDVLVEAMPDVVAQHPGTRLVVVGGAAVGDVRALDLPRRTRHLLDDLDVRLLGRLDDVAKARRLAGARALVAPNTGGESFGIVLVEALAAGAPVVASDLAAFRAVLDDGRRGRLAPVGDPAALASALSASLGDVAGTERLVAEGARAARDVYDWDVVAPAVLGVYGEAGRTLLGFSSARSAT